MVIHIDCNNFFVSCELVSRPELKGRPVVVANNNDNNGGIILALNQPAKDVGLKRGDPLFKVPELLKRHNVEVIDVHHQLYHDISHRIMEVVKQTEMVLDFVQYSVDEFFGYMPEDEPDALRGYLQQLKDLILRETSIPVSCGAGQTYTLAKTATHFAKRDPGYKGICVLTPDKREKALGLLAANEVWGIGRRSVKTLDMEGVRTALDYAQRPQAWIKRRFGVTGLRTWQELNGTPSITFDGRSARQKSIMYSRTFAHMITGKTDLLRELSNHAVAATRRLREQQSLCQTVTIFIATNRHREDLPQYANDQTLRLRTATDDTTQIIAAVSLLLDRIYRNGYLIKQAGVILGQLTSSGGVQLDLFSPNQTMEMERKKRLMKAVDAVNSKFGKNQLHFAVQGQDASEDQPAGFMRSHKA